MSMASMILTITGWGGLNETAPIGSCSNSWSLAGRTVLGRIGRCGLVTGDGLCGFRSPCQAQSLSASNLWIRCKL